MDLFLLLLYLFLTIVISFLCSILESTLMSTPLSYISMREDDGYKPAVKFKEFKQNSSRPIAAILSLNTIANTIGAALVGVQATRAFGSAWFGFISGVMTVLILICSEIIPKTIGTTRWKSLMGFATVMISALTFVMFPIVWVLEKITDAITPEDAEDASVSRDEVSAMADLAEEEGNLEEDENTIIQNLINMDEITAADVMTPRVVAAIAPETTTVKSFYKNKSISHHSRIPVYGEDDEYITGYVLRMDVLQLMAEDKFDKTIGEIKRPIPSFSEDTPLDEIWDEMIGKSEQIAVIINEYGSFQGIITLEDVFETLLDTEIVDERDNVRDMQQLAREKWKAAKIAAKTKK